jgi:hypothetical protein
MPYSYRTSKVMLQTPFQQIDRLVLFPEIKSLHSLRLLVKYKGTNI